VDAPKKNRVWSIACGRSAPTSAEGGGVDVVEGEGDERLYMLCSKTEGGKLIVHDVSIESGMLRRKIKVGSVEEIEEGSSASSVAPVLDLAGSPDGRTLAVRNGNQIRLMNNITGERLQKCKIGEQHSSSSSSSSVLVFSDDSTSIGCSTPVGLSIFSASTGQLRHSLKSEAQVGGASLFLRGGGGEGGTVLTVEPSAGASRIYVLGDGVNDGGSGAAPSSPALSVRTTATGGGIMASASFHSTRPGEAISILLPPSGGGGGRGTGSAAEVREVEYRSRDGALKKSEGGDNNNNVIVVLSAREEEERRAEDAALRKKRNASGMTTASDHATVLGPGEGGGEALGASDARVAVSKRARTGDNEKDDDDFLLPDDDAPGTSIADRLRVLSEEMGRTDDDDDDDDDAPPLSSSRKVGKFKPEKVTTSDSLSALLRQSLSSNDDIRLDVALDVSNPKIIENSVASLLEEDENSNDGGNGNGDLIITLLSKLVTRIARRPGRAVTYGNWVRTVLVALTRSSSRGGGYMGTREREVASRLLPLRNLLNERVSCLPDLLRLEGRLALLGQRM